MRRIIHRVRAEIVLTIASFLAILSMFAIPPGATYLAYIDLRVLSLLFCLMAVVAGFMKEGLFDALSMTLLNKSQNLRVIALILVNCSFFTAMFVTNDVALIAFVPLTLSVLQLIDHRQVIFVIVMETIAANLGSMLTPIGNPQNLYLYSFFELNIGSFLRMVWPIGLISYILITGLMLTMRNATIRITYTPIHLATQAKQRIGIYLTLFLLCLLTVLHILNDLICLAIIVAVVFLVDRSLFKRIDYSLLLTFVAFFILVGNLGQIEFVHQNVAAYLSGKELLASALISQVISNVPAAIMLSTITDQVKPLLLGVNIGGLGTLVASLASLISFRIYVKSEGAVPLRYLKTFSMYNFILLIALLLIAGIFVNLGV